jgi:NAD(P)-dependent dehydrogenase (short-subunit alcohol dehydrogenase family)
MQRIFISGANRGIGLGLARHFVERGEQVFATARQPDAAHDLLALREAYPERLVILSLDVREDAQIEQAARQVADRTDGLDLLINNAGILIASSSFTELTRAQWLEDYNLNLVSGLVVTRYLLPLLAAGRAAGISPRIVNITAPLPPPSQLRMTRNHALVGSRYALNGLTKMLALELHEQGVIVVALWPGYIRTDMNDHAEAAEPMQTAIPKAVAVIDAITANDSGWCLLPDGRRL